MNDHSAPLLREFHISDGDRRKVVALRDTTAPEAWLTLWRIPADRVADAYDLGFPDLFPGRTPATDRQVEDREVWVRFTPTTPGKEAWTLRVRQGEFVGQGVLL